MKVIVYLDVFFLLNLGMNWFILGIHGKIVKGRTSCIRMMAASILGALGGCILLIMPIHNAVLVFLIQYAGMGCLMMWTLYGKLPKSRLGKYVFAFYVVSIFIGGAINFLNEAFSLKKSGILFVLSCGFFLYVGIRFVLWKWGGSLGKERSIYSVDVHYQNKTISGYGFYDTGNHLKEPISGKPVIVAEYEFIKDLFSEDEKNEIADFPEYTKEIGCSAILRWIPYHSLGMQKGVLPGIEIDGIGIGKGNERKWLDNVYLAIYMDRISTDRSYQFILHHECFV